MKNPGVHGDLGRTLGEIARNILTTEMKKKILPILMIVALSACEASAEYRPREGDIIFQTSLSSQSAAIQAATNSRYSHVGIVYLQEGAPYVYEAIGPVTFTPLDAWIARGDESHFVVKRLKDADRVLTAEALEKMKAVGKRFEGKPYDLVFQWTDEKIYCSELVWKIYKGALGIEVGSLQNMRDFDLTDRRVKLKVEERYGDDVPLDETVISPASIFQSPLLTTVHQ
jgi:hypothetical protein